ncbi:MAG: MATE family efflux transporter [Clostridiales bacterium]|nr:MATE family efflux transporter [Clostridiales bacterium]
MSQSKIKDLTKGKVSEILRKLTVPMILGIFGMVIFNLVDTYFVSKLGTLQIAALTFTFPVVLIINSINLGLGIGAAAVISKAVGENDREKVIRLSTDSISLGIVVAVILAIVGELTIKPLFTALGADQQAMVYIMQYMRIWYAGVPLVVIPMIGNNAIRALGDTKTPSVVMLIAAIVNTIMDPLLIFGLGPFPELGVQGAAIATAIARFITFAVSLYVLIVREKVIVVKIIEIKEMLSSWKDILFIGLPNAIARAIIPLGAGVITKIISGFGNVYVAAFGIGTKIEFFSLAIVIALVAVIPVFVGQNFGGKRIDRIKEAILVSKKFTIYYSVVIYILIFLFARPLASLFSKEKDVISNVILYLRIVPLAYGFQGVLMIINGALNALRKPIIAALLNIIQMLAVYVPLAYFLSKPFGMVGIFVSLVISYILLGTISIGVFNRGINKL